MTDADVRQALSEVVDPEIGLNIVDLGLVYDIDIRGEDVAIRMAMTSAACPLRDYLADQVESAIRTHFPSVQKIRVHIVSDPPWTPARMSDAARRRLA